MRETGNISEKYADYSFKCLEDKFFERILEGLNNVAKNFKFFQMSFEILKDDKLSAQTISNGHNFLDKLQYSSGQF